MNISHEQAEQLVQELFQLERSGEYEEAISKLGDIWEDKTKKPKIDKFEPKLSAEILLRCGSLIGFLGHNKQIPNSQEKSKNLLTEARDKYLEILEIEKVAECENYIALSYWRTGELTEAETWIEESLSHKIDDTRHIRIYSHLTKSVIFLAKENYQEIVKNLKAIETTFKKHGDDFLNGSFCTNLGLALKNLDIKSEALKYFELARLFHTKSKHQIYLGTVENNLAQLYKINKQFEKAHQAIDNATKIFKRLKDHTREGFSLDTKAQIYFVDEKYDESLECSDKAIKILKSSENVAYLVEAYLTKIKNLISLNKLFEALQSLAKAVTIADTRIGKEAGDRVTKEIETILKSKIVPVIKNVFGEEQIIVDGFKNDPDEQLSNSGFDMGKGIVLPLELRKYKKLDGVVMSNNFLEEIGISESSVAIIAEEVEIINGDLITIMEIADDTVHCGYYSADMGFVSLEKPDAEVQVFNENEVRILGKIVGVGHEQDEEGRLIIRPI